MRAHQIMTRKVTAVKADTPVPEAANLMLQQHISGLPMVDETGRLIGMVSEGDFTAVARSVRSVRASGGSNS